MNNFKEQYSEILKLYENMWNKMKENRVMDINNFYYGSVDPVFGFNPQHQLAVTISLYCSDKSSLYKNQELLEDIKMLLAYLLRLQSEDGLISLITCNIQSPPDTAFAINTLSQCYKLLCSKNYPETKFIQSELKNFLYKTIPGMLNGGIHTPNHRWVICCALAMLYEIFGLEELKERAFLFLNEGLDISEDGEWTERSNSIYNPVCDMFLYHVGRIFNYNEAFDAIRKNLTSMQYMLHPGNVVATEFSRRQDRRGLAYLNETYYLIYKIMAVKDNNPTYSAMAQIAYESLSKVKMNEALIYMMLYPDVFEAQVPAGELPLNYKKLFGDKLAPSEKRVDQNYKHKLSVHKLHDILRYRNEKLSVTVMSAQPDIMYLQYGSARLLGLKVVIGYFGVAGVAFTSIEPVDNDTYIMELEIEGTYKGPLSNELTDGLYGVYDNLPNHMRNVTNSVILKVRIELKLLADGIDIDVSVGDIPNIFAQIAFLLDKSGEISGDGISFVEPGVCHFEKGNAVYKCGNDVIEISGGLKEHNFVTLRNDYLASEAINVLVNCTTPVSRKFSIRCYEENN